jgi:hypothetical protein
VAGNLTAAERCISDIRAKEELMRPRALFVGTVGALLLAVATPAVAKVGIAKAHINGPGLVDDGLRISDAVLEGMWDSGIDVAGGLDDTRGDSVAELGLTVPELGPKYVIDYRLDAGTKAAETVRQELYPYASGGPVTYTPPGQGVAEGLPWGGTLSAGWYQASPGFFSFLVDQGLPESNPVVGANREYASDSVPAAGPTLWGWIAPALAALVALSVAATRLRRRS